MSVSVVEWVTASAAVTPGVLALVGLSLILLRRVARLVRRTRKGQRPKPPPSPDPVA